MIVTTRSLSLGGDHVLSMPSDMPGSPFDIRTGHPFCDSGFRDLRPSPFTETTN